MKREVLGAIQEWMRGELGAIRGELEAIREWIRGELGVKAIREWIRKELGVEAVREVIQERRRKNQVKKSTIFLSFHLYFQVFF